jgi:hypothetical protein
MGPRAGLDDVEKRKFSTPPGLEFRLLNHSSPLSVALPTALPRLRFRLQRRGRNGLQHVRTRDRWVERFSFVQTGNFVQTGK